MVLLEEVPLHALAAHEVVHASACNAMVAHTAHGTDKEDNTDALRLGVEVLVVVGPLEELLDVRTLVLHTEAVPSCDSHGASEVPVVPAACDEGQDEDAEAKHCALDQLVACHREQLVEVVDVVEEPQLPPVQHDGVELDAAKLVAQEDQLVELPYQLVVVLAEQVLVDVVAVLRMLDEAAVWTSEYRWECDAMVLVTK